MTKTPDRKVAMRPIKLDEATRAAIREGRDQARRGEFASDEEMVALFRGLSTDSSNDTR